MWLCLKKSKVRQREPERDGMKTRNKGRNPCSKNRMPQRGFNFGRGDGHSSSIPAPPCFLRCNRIPKASPYFISCTLLRLLFSQWSIGGYKMPRTFEPAIFYIGAKLQVMKRVNSEGKWWICRTGISLMTRNRNVLLFRLLKQRVIRDFSHCFGY